MGVGLRDPYNMLPFGCYDPAVTIKMEKKMIMAIDHVNMTLDAF